LKKPLPRIGSERSKKKPPPLNHWGGKGEGPAVLSENHVIYTEGKGRVLIGVRERRGDPDGEKGSIDQKKVLHVKECQRTWDGYKREGKGHHLSLKEGRTPH